MEERNWPQQNDRIGLYGFVDGFWHLTSRTWNWRNMELTKQQLPWEKFTYEIDSKEWNWETLSNWQSISRGAPHGSIPSPLLFNLLMHDLSYVIGKSTVSTYVDDTQIFYGDNDLSRVEETINNDLVRVDTWFAQNGMKRNSSNYQAIVLRKNKGTEQAFKCDESQVSI